MNKGEYLDKAAAQVDDTSVRARAILDTSLTSTYTEVMQSAATYLIEEEEIADQAVLDQRYTDLAFEFSRIEKVFYKKEGSTSFKELKRMNRDDYDPNNAQGEIAQFYIKGDRIYFDRKSIDAGVIHLIYIPEMLALSTDTVELRIPDKYEAVIIYGTVMRFLAYEGDAGMSEFSAMFIRELDSMIKELATQQKTLRPRLYGEV